MTGRRRRRTGARQVVRCDTAAQAATVIDLLEAVGFQAAAATVADPEVPGVLVVVDRVRRP